MILYIVLKIAINIKDDNFKWLTFEEFKKIEIEIIALDKDIIEELTLEKICSSINEIDLNKEEQINEINTMNNFEDKKENDEIEINNSLINDEINNSKNDIINNSNNSDEKKNF